MVLLRPKIKKENGCTHFDGGGSATGHADPRSAVLSEDKLPEGSTRIFEKV